MHPLRKLRESGKPPPAQVSALLAENIVFNSPLLVWPIEGREVIAAILGEPQGIAVNLSVRFLPLP